MGAGKKTKVPVKVVVAAKAVAQARAPLKVLKAVKPEKPEKAVKAKLVAALKRLHPMD